MSRSIVAAAIVAGLITAAVAVAYRGGYWRPRPAPNAEQPVVPIPLSGDIAVPDTELSGLAWYGDDLVLLPQFPDRTATDDNPDGFLYRLRKSDLLAVLDGGRAGPLNPDPIPFHAPEIDDAVKGFEGFEGIKIDGDRVYMTIESHRKKREMRGYLIAGTVAPGLSRVEMEVARLAELPPQTDLENVAYEAVTVLGDTDLGDTVPGGVVLVLYEANGARVNPAPYALRFDRALAPLGTVPAPVVEYRITDATDVDARGRFWALNTFSPNDRERLDPARDAIAATYGQGATHARYPTVERLVELAYTDRGVALTDTPPIQLVLTGGERPRNWEGVVRLDDRGFLLATDEHPETVLGFVARP